MSKKERADSLLFYTITFRAFREKLIIRGCITKLAYDKPFLGFKLIICAWRLRYNRRKIVYSSYENP